MLCMHRMAAPRASPTTRVDVCLLSRLAAGPVPSSRSLGATCHLCAGGMSSGGRVGGRATPFLARMVRCIATEK